MFENLSSYHLDVNYAFIDDCGEPHVKQHADSHYSSDKTLQDVCKAHKLPYEHGQIALNGEMIPEKDHTISLKALCEKYDIYPIPKIYFTFLTKTGSYGDGCR